MSIVIGIDLGTSFCCVAAIRDNAVVVVEDDEGHKTMPSVVHFDRHATVAGFPALQQLIDDPENCVHSVKRILGYRFGDPPVRIAQSAYLYKVVEGPNRWPLIETRQGAQTVPAVCGVLLEELRERAVQFFGEPVAGAVIAVPANASDAQREQTRLAGKSAGLEVLGLINEPTAAALAYALLGARGRTMAVYDFGGGTFDCSIIEWTSPGGRVLATHGDSFLGGDDIDMALAVHVALEFQRRSGVDLRQRSADWRRLVLACEQAKRRLSRQMTATIRLPSAAHTASGALDLEHELDRSRLERLAAPYVEQTVEIMSEALQMASLKASQLDQVLLVGGSSRLPQVREAVTRALGRVPLINIDPDTAVSIGAAVEAYRLAGFRSPTLAFAGNPIEEVVSHSFGLATAGGGYDALIPRNSPLPAKGSRTYTTWRDGQREMRFIVLEGDSAKADENTKIGEFVVDSLPARPAGAVEVELSFEVAGDGLLRVSARETTTGSVHQLGVRVGDTPTGR